MADPGVATNSGISCGAPPAGVAAGAGFRVAGEEAGGLAEIVAQRLRTEKFAGFVFDGLAAILPDDFDDFADAAIERSLKSAAPSRAARATSTGRC